MNMLICCAFWQNLSKYILLQSHPFFNSVSDTVLLFESFQALWYHCLWSTLRQTQQHAISTRADTGNQYFMHLTLFLHSLARLLSLISLLFLIWGNNLVSSNPIAGDFLPPEWVELKFHCLLADSDTHTHDVASNFSGHVRSLAVHQVLNLLSNWTVEDYQHLLSCLPSSLSTRVTFFLYEYLYLSSLGFVLIFVWKASCHVKADILKLFR